MSVVEIQAAVVLSVLGGSRRRHRADDELERPDNLVDLSSVLSFSAQLMSCALFCPLCMDVLF